MVRLTLALTQTLTQSLAQVDKGEPTEKSFDFDMLLISAMNTKYTGDGLALSPYAQMDDGKFDILFNSKPIKRRLQAIKLFDGVKAGGKHVYDRAVTILQGSSLRLETPKPTRLNFDGENAGATPLDMKLIPKAVRIICPEVGALPHSNPNPASLAMSFARFPMSLAHSSWP